jgi:CRISPR/Cas system-associated exonuclease Cas4 (RecB family)
MLIQKFNYPNINREVFDGKRHYVTPLGDRVPSVTTILDKTKPEEARQALANWKKAVGEKKAQEITSEAAGRGTRMHKYLEDYIKGESLKESVSNPYANQSLLMAKKVITEGFGAISEVWGSEVPLYFPELYAGTTDCVGVHNGQEAILDFKQSNKPKKREHIEDYFLQLTAYALAHNEVHGTNIRKGVILMCVRPPEIAPGQWGEPIYNEFVLEASDFDYWTGRWCDRVSQYYRI